MMDKDTEKMLRAEVTERDKIETDAKAFHTQWAKTRQSMPNYRPASSGAASSSRDTRRAAPKSMSGKKLPKRLVGDLTILQSSVRDYAPVGGYIWRGNTTLTWNCHFKPNFPRRTFTTKVVGERAAILGCLRYLWTCYNIEQGRPEGTCPIEGIFEGPPPECLEVAE